MAEPSPVPTDVDDDAVEGRDDVASTPTPATAAAPARPTHVPRSVRSLLWQARIGAGAAVLFAVLAAVLFLQASDLRADAADRAAVLDAGQVTALRVTTFEGATIDEWVADTQRLATGSYAEEVAALFDSEIRQGLAAYEVQSVGEITDSFVQRIDGDTATVFAVLRQTFTSTAQPTPTSDELRMEIELTRVDGAWLASDVAVLGPSVISPVGDQPIPGVDPDALAPEQDDP